MEEDKRISLDASGYLADSELKPNPLFSELLVKKKSSVSAKSVSWVGEFCFQKGSRSYILGNEFFCVIDKDFLEDELNYEGLQDLIPFPKYAMCTILDLQLPGSLLLMASRRRQPVPDQRADSEERRRPLRTPARALHQNGQRNAKGPRQV